MRCFLAVILVCAATLNARPGEGIVALSAGDRALARDIFRELIEIRTTYEAGTTAAANAMAERLRAAGFAADEMRILGPAPSKMNLVVRLKGSGAAKPLLLIAHLDVVEARRQDWTTDPFRFVEKDGFFYGRGATDCKSEAADLVMLLIWLRQSHITPSRDIIVALTADEETGEETNGVRWLVANDRDLIDAEYCINTDMGGGDIVHGKHAMMQLQTNEKVYLDLQLEVRDRGGHSARPVNRENAIYRLARALLRIADYGFPIRLNETTRAYFERIAQRETPAVADAIRAFLLSPDDSSKAATLAAASPVYNALMRTTAVATMARAGHAANALPQMAQAVVNCRILPAESPDSVQETLRRVVADTAVHVTRLQQPKPSPPLRSAATFSRPSSTSPR